MFFSVIIPTCNRNELLATCLEQLKPGVQSLPSANYEVIVSDDSRNFDAEVFLREHYSWVRYTKGPQKGPAANRNNGVKIAKGAWLVFLDDDCIPAKELLSAYKILIDQQQGQVLEGCIRNDQVSKNPLEHAPLNLLGGNLWSCNFCINKNLFERLQGFDEKFIFPHMEDADLKKRLDAMKQPIVFVPAAIVVHPWRVISNGIKLGRYQEMNVYFHRKHNVQYNLLNLLRSVFFVHWSMLKRRPVSINHLVAIKVTVEHLLVVVLKYKSWSKKYVAGN